ncbi:2-hydroxyacid dehydrogenase [Aneurinibacillus aneurinilyticus]|uniref:D-glycerate dehydrogenase n=2 Tax=Aneurinibacillus aneurinilyticus TaxID=1391 RepID=A0A848CY07_ANEAE|nr:D-glycerate dehydrogenase [Aneurinibacillus aneurinilyticus]ERI09418.1 glyoxylate reductase [Aneurinibacillus aneurinilyticus ATCC 12856]MCI1695927.1 D-glycerate dehydrogenase [Aneurinibacillus aneurinilyticus]MED0668662.1 D-glycerate dehydrogenase [Aneurinibacillus aneurinilyticus]MED0707592.1 D-glycerate dehydrogenase [Aneurinibacillus aneurinilyticus]MED0722816.1 D-glycerate dehydrogenase [Aneurinibacillus aneurinilyticus]
MQQKKIVVTRNIPREALALLKEHGNVYVWDSEDDVIPYETLVKEVKDAAALYTIIGDRIDKNLLDHAPYLEVISTMAVGYDNIDVAEARRRGIPVGHTPGILTETTADLTFALLMAAARRLVESADYLRQGQWKSWSPMLLTGQDIYGATLGIIGMGRIGESVARRATGFNMRILYHNRSRRLGAEETLGAIYCSMEELLQKSDFVVLLTPGSSETRYLMGEAEFKRMKSSAVFINVSRGSNVDEVALYNALRNGTIWAAGLDVFETEPVASDHPLLSLPNVVALPHIGSASIHTRIRMAVLAAKNLIAGLRKEPLPFEVK